MAKKKLPAPKGEHTEKKPAAATMESLRGKATKVPEKTAKKTKPTIRLEGNEAEVFDAFCAVDSVFQVIQANHEMAKTKAAEIIKSIYIRLCCERGYTPPNPQVVTSASKANFINKKKGTLKRTPAPNGELLSIEDQLRQLGFDDDVVQAITTKVIKEKLHLGLKAFSELQGEDSTSTERAVAQKIMDLIQNNLNEEELSLCLEENMETTVDDGWKDIAVSLACKVGGNDIEKSVEALAKLYSVIPTICYMSNKEFSGDTKNILERMLDTPLPEKKTTVQSANGKYEAECVGNNVTLYIVKPDGKEEVGTKECENSNHAEMSARKWFREPDALNEILASFATAGKK